ncbi:MAG: PH domain-containing protein [Ilumatobacter sp.]
MDDTTTERLVNEPIDVTGLPRLRSDAFVSVDARFELPSIVGWIVAALAFAIVGVIVAAQSGAAVWYFVGAGASVVAVALAVYTRLASLRVAYQLRDHDVSLRSGLISHSEATVPFRRVQHVYLSRGVFERWLGLSTLSINSAGPDISVPGLDADLAASVREFITVRAGLDTEGNDPFADDGDGPWGPPTSVEPSLEAPPTPTTEPAGPPPPEPPATGGSSPDRPTSP